MAKIALIEKMNRRKNQIGVKYLIEEDSTGEVRRTDILIGSDENPSVYGNQNAEDIFAAGDVVSEGTRAFESLREETVKDLHERALFTIKEGIRNEDALGDILDAIMAVYQDAGETRTIDLLVDVYQTWNAGTNGEKNQFIIFMLYVLTVLR